MNGTYKHGGYSTFKVYEPKERFINSLPFGDRVVQHSFNNFLEPIFDKVFYPCSYACRKGKGTHTGVKAVYKLIRKDTVVRAKRKVKRFTRLKLSKELDMFMASWTGHIMWADGFNLLNKLKGVTNGR
jgi:retron-type reverse transcriptase